MRIVQYRCVAEGVKIDGHGLQNITYSMHDADDWAHKISNAYNCIVKVYVARENLIKTVKPTIARKVKHIEKETVPKKCLICGNLNCFRPQHADYKGRIQE